MTEVTGAEEGEYTCRGENVAGEVTLAARLVGNTLPRVRLVPASSVVLRPGSRLQIECHVSGDPEPTRQWRRMGKTMTDLRSSSPTLVIERLTKQDEGTYSCLASSEAGQVEERLQVMVADSDTEVMPQPQAPYSVREPEPPEAEEEEASLARFPPP